MASPPPVEYVVRYYVHNKENYAEEKIFEIAALPTSDVLDVIDRIEGSFEETRTLETRIRGYLSSIRKGLPEKQERRALAKLNRANRRLEEMRDSA